MIKCGSWTREPNERSYGTILETVIILNIVNKPQVLLDHLKDSCEYFVSIDKKK